MAVNMLTRQPNRSLPRQQMLASCALVVGAAYARLGSPRPSCDVGTNIRRRRHWVPIGKPAYHKHA